MLGQTISHYKITAKLGEGGIGVADHTEDDTSDHVYAIGSNGAASRFRFAP